MSDMIISILLYVGSLFILYIVIETVIRRGINNSMIGQALEKKLGIQEEKKTSFFDHDVDDH